MALVECPECANQVSDRATACPKCGCPLDPSRFQLEARHDTSTSQASAFRQPTAAQRHPILMFVLVVFGLALARSWYYVNVEFAPRTAENAKSSAAGTALKSSGVADYQARLKESEAQRKRSVSEGIASAKRLLASGTCPKAETRNALNSLSNAREGDAEWAEVFALLNKLKPCRIQIEREEAKARHDAETAAASAAIAGRELWARQAEKTMLGKGMEVDFILSGGSKDLLTVKWILMSKVQVYQITEDDSMREGSFLANLQKAGFRKVTFTDGYDYGVTYTLPSLK